MQITKDKLNIAVIGGGGREHAIIRRLAQSRRAGKIYALPGNGGISREHAGSDSCPVTCTGIAATDLEKIVDFVLNNEIDFAAVIPDDPLVMGLCDMLREKGIPCFGPSKAAAIIEGSKAFSKELMKKYGIPTAEYKVFSDADAAAEYAAHHSLPVVVKADGLALGKGIIIAKTHEEAVEAVNDMMRGGKFGRSGATVVVEEFLTGPEACVAIIISSRSPSTRGSTACVSGSPKRQLYSITRGPFGVSISPKYRHPRKVRPSRKNTKRENSSPLTAMLKQIAGYASSMREQNSEHPTAANLLQAAGACSASRPFAIRLKRRFGRHMRQLNECISTENIQEATSDFPHCAKAV